MHDEFAFDHLQKKGSSAREDGNESREAKGVRTNLDGLNGQNRTSTLAATARLGGGGARIARTASSSSTRSSGRRGCDLACASGSGLGHEGRASSGGRLGSRLESGRSTEGTSAGALSGRLGRVVLVKNETKLLGRVAHAVGTVVAGGGVLLKC